MGQGDGRFFRGASEAEDSWGPPTVARRNRHFDTSTHFPPPIESSPMDALIPMTILDKLILPYLVSLLASLHGERIAKERENNLRNAIPQDLGRLGEVPPSTSLSDRLIAIAAYLVRARANLGFTEDEAALLELLCDPLFVNDLCLYIQSYDRTERNTLKDRINGQLKAVLEPRGFAIEKIEKLQSEHLDRFAGAVMADDVVSRSLFDKGQRSILDRVEKIDLEMQSVQEVLRGIDQALKSTINPDVEGQTQFLLRQSQARCRRLFEAAGISGSIAKDLAQQMSVGQRILPLGKPTEFPVTVIIGPVGAGKSLVLERLNQQSIEAFSASPDIPIPVFLNVNLLSGGGFFDVVENHATKLGSPLKNGVHVFIDGADEGGVHAYRTLVNDSQVLTESVPNSSVYLTARTILPEKRSVHTVSLPPLEEAEILRIVKTVLGDEPWHLLYHSLERSLREAVTRPLFAVLLGVSLRDRGGRLPTSRAALVSHLIAHSLGDSSQPAVSVQRHLRYLAIKSTDSSGNPIPWKDIVNWDERVPLLESRLVIEEDGNLSFPIPLFREWFAAQALLRREIEIEELLRDVRRLERWKPVLIIGIGIGNEERIGEILSLLGRADPGFASQVVEHSIEDYWLPDEAKDLDAMRCGESIRKATLCWLSGIPSISSFVAPLDESGRLRPLGASVGSGGLTTAWYMGSNPQADVLPLPNAMAIAFRQSDPNWSFTKMAFPSPHPGWAWKWSHDSLRDQVRHVVNTRELGLPSRQLHEYIWSLALDLLKKPNLDSGPVHFQDLRNALKGLPRIVSVHGPRIDVKSIIDFCDQSIETGARDLEPPWPLPDLKPRGGFIWSYYSEKQLLKRAEAIYSGALEGYIQLVESWFPELASRLQIYATLPGTMKGYLRPAGCTGTHVDRPWLTWFLVPEANPRGSSVEFTLGEGKISQSEMREFYEMVCKERPDCADWISFRVQKVAVTSWNGYPMTDLAYKWVLDDLTQISWA